MTLEIDALVELQDQYSDVYPLSPSGARGWVRGRREMAKLDPEVYIEWDKDHWRYHGERDGWTFEHHFQLVNDAIISEEPEVIPDLFDILTEAKRRVEGEKQEENYSPEEFLTTLLEAQELAIGSEGYLIVTLTPRNENGLIVYEPTIHSSVLTQAAKEVLEAQILLMASQLYQDAIIYRMQEFDGE